jgi:L-rhamnose isomerase
MWADLNSSNRALGGGLVATGNYRGKARTLRNCAKTLMKPIV